MDGLLPIALRTVVLDAADGKALAAFYVELLGWQKLYEDDEWTDIGHPDGGVRLGFQTDPAYVPPGWPDDPPAQQQMLHLDFGVANAAEMERAVTHALRCGAKKADVQYDEKWTVMLDPAGHPFCFVVSD